MAAATEHYSAAPERQRSTGQSSATRGLWHDESRLGGVAPYALLAAWICFAGGLLIQYSALLWSLA